MLVCEGLNIGRGGKGLLNGVTFTVSPGNTLLLHGANGSGKTTLLRALAGLVPFSAGKLTWNEKIVRNLRDVQLFVGHAPAVSDSLSVLENLELWARLRDSRLSVPAAVHYFDLAAHLHVMAGKLSAGYRRRVALARAMIIQAPVWLLDEPMSHLDAAMQARVTEMVAAHTKQGGIALIAAHGDGFDGAVRLNVEEFRCAA